MPAPKSAKKAKLKGNKAVKKEDHTAALESYTKGLDVEPGNSESSLKVSMHELGRPQDPPELLKRSSKDPEIEKLAAELKPEAPNQKRESKLPMWPLQADHPELKEWARTMDAFQHGLEELSSFPFEPDEELVLQEVSTDTHELSQAVRPASELEKAAGSLEKGKHLWSLKSFSCDFEALMRGDPALSAALEGDRLISELHGMLADYGAGPHGEEDQDIKHLLNEYVRNTMAKLITHSKGANVLLSSFNEDEKHIGHAIRAKSLELSSGDYCAGRDIIEQERIDEMRKLIIKQEDKLYGVDERTKDRLNQTLDEQLVLFEAAYVELVAKRQCEHSQQSDWAAETQAKQKGLGAYVRVQKTRLEDARSLVTEKNAQRTQQVREQLKVADEALKSILVLLKEEQADRAEIHRAESVVKMAGTVVDSANEELQSQFDQHDDLSKRAQSGAQLLERMAAWIRTAYAGMAAKTKKTAADLLQTLPISSCMHEKLVKAVLKELEQQDNTLRGHQEMTKQYAIRQELDLQRLQYSGATKEKIKLLKTELDDLTSSYEYQASARRKVAQSLADVKEDLVRYQDKLHDFDHGFELVHQKDTSLAVGAEKWIERLVFTNPPGFKTLASDGPASDGCSFLCVSDVSSCASNADGPASDGCSFLCVTDVNPGQD